MEDEGALNSAVYLHMRRCQRSNHRLDFSHLNDNGEQCLEPSVSTRLRYSSIEHGERCIKSLLGNAPVCNILDHILAIPGFQHGMRLRTFHKIMAMKCNEEIIHYLQYILDIWQSLIPDDPTAIQKLDVTTVQALELICPKYSAGDKERLESLMSSGEILQAFTASERQIIVQNVLATDCILPSLHSLFEDVKFLDPCAKTFRHLLGIFGRSKQTVTSALRECFQPKGHDHNQVGVRRDLESVASRLLSPELQFDLGRKRIWLFIMRACIRLVPSRRSLKGRLTTIIPYDMRSGELRKLANLALEQGFCNTRIEQLAQLALASGVTHHAQSHDRTSSTIQGEGDSDSDTPVQDPSEHVGESSQPRNITGSQDSPTWTDTETSRRSGLPYVGEHLRDQQYMFLDVLAASNARICGVTSLFVRRCVFYAFFGCGSCSTTTIASRDGMFDIYKRDSCYSSDSSVAVRSSELALVRRVSACMTEESIGIRVEGNHALRRRESRIQRDMSRFTPEYRLRLGKQWISFISRENNEWRLVSQVPSHDALGVREAAATYMANGLRPFEVARSRMRPIFPEECHNAALASSAQIVVLVPVNNACITRDLRISAERLHCSTVTSNSEAEGTRCSDGAIESTPSSLYST